MKITFSRHAEEKFQVLARHGFPVERHVVERVVRNPETLDHAHSPLIIAQVRLDTAHVLRVVYKEKNGALFVITFYPGRLKQYGI